MKDQTDTHMYKVNTIMYQWQEFRPCTTASPRTFGLGVNPLAKNYG